MKRFHTGRSRRGMTLAEVLIVVAIMAIMLGIAVPNLLAESKKINMAALDSHARAVAVAVQSKLYGMKNAGTTANSSYANLNAVAEEGCITAEDGEKPVNYVCNFGKNAAVGKQYLLSGAITDTELLQKGKIVVVYDPATADILEVYYSEKEFPVEQLFPVANKEFLEENGIGLYRGEGAPEPERNVSLPSFSVLWKDDDEKYLELTMKNEPDPKLLDKHLGLEVYALLPTDNESSPGDPLLIYAEGIVAFDYTATEMVNPDYKTISNEVNEPLTLRKIIDVGEGKMRFAIDSMVIQRASYDQYDATQNAVITNEAKKNLHHQVSPMTVSVAEPVLYPRETVSNWLNGLYNPYISFGIHEKVNDVSETLEEKLFDPSTEVTDYVGVNDGLKLRLKLYVLKEKETGGYETSADGSRYVQDEEFGSFEITSENTSPYFHSYSDRLHEVSLSSIRDLQNLRYVFEVKNPSITQARLYNNITSQQLYEKLVSVRYAYLGKHKIPLGEFNALWPDYATRQLLQVDSLFYVDYSDIDGGFTITGEKSSGEGCYSIESVPFGGNDMSPGGWIKYAKNIKVKNLDIVNPQIWKHADNRNFFKTDSDGDITGFSVDWDSGITGSLFSIAENCTFENVHCYIDASRVLHIESHPLDHDTGERGLTPIIQYFVSNMVVGGLAGIAVGSHGNATTFDRCGVSVIIGSTFFSDVSYVDYAGGLAGVAMGNVSIKNSYAASQLSGRYAGGLVGAVANGHFQCNIDGDGFPEANYDVSGTLTIKNSFSAGRILRPTRVGGGLIAQITNSAKGKVDATNCYSATVWDVLPPVAYATFEGDTSCSYLTQKEITLPITLNADTRFSIDGDVFALQETEKSGNVCTPTELKAKIGNGDWTAAANTLQWRWANSVIATYLMTDDTSGSGNVSSPYPYPMPKGNTFFCGDWLENDANTDIKKNVNATFMGYYCAVYDLGDDYYILPADPGRIMEVPFEFVGAAPMLKGKALGEDELWWLASWEGNVKNAFPYLPNVIGMTDVTVDGDTVTFEGTSYYSEKYDPGKGYGFSPKIAETLYVINFNYYLGYYATRAIDGLGQYYLLPDADTPAGSAAMEGNRLKVNEDELKAAIGYKSFTFQKSGATLSWEDGHFFVK